MHVKGYVLAEALIAMLVLSIGMLGLVSLQANMHGQTVNAQQRLEAVIKANEIISMAIADSANAQCYVLPVANQGGCGSTVASAYTTNWLAEVQNRLPGTVATPPVVSVDGNNVITVTIVWQRTNEPFAHNYVISGQLGL